MHLLCKGNIISGEASSKREFMCYLLQSSLQEKCIDYSGQEEGAEMSIRNIHNTPPPVIILQKVVSKMKNIRKREKRK